MNAYYGHTTNLANCSLVVVFTSATKPTRESHPQYLAVVGPYRNKNEARNAVRMSNRYRNAELRILD